MDITRSKCKSMIERVISAVSDFPEFAEQAQLPVIAAAIYFSLYCFASL